MRPAYRGFTVVIGGRVARFVGRSLEVRELLGRLRTISPFPVILYGPIGSGKTALLRYLAYLARREEAISVYIDGSRPSGAGSVRLSGVPGIHYYVEELMKSLLRGADSAGVKEAILRITSSLTTLVGNYGVRGKLLLMIDDAHRSLSKDELLKYCKSLYEWVKWDLSGNISGALTILVAPHRSVLNDGALSSRSVLPFMLWNLPRDDFIKLVRQVSVPDSLEPNELWLLTGGNPGALEWLMMLDWRVEEWLEAISSNLVARAEALIGRARLKALAEDPDADEEAAKALEDLGLMIRTGGIRTFDGYLTRSSELGIGRYWAWQVPAYREVASRS